jgi:hypothetical protein
MIYKISISASGNYFLPETVINKVMGDFTVESYFSSTDKKNESSNEAYGYGSITFWHPKKFALEDNILEYEMSFSNFIEQNYRLFKENGAEDFQMFIEVYYSDGQCNFEIFNKELMRKITRFGMSFPVSVYELQNNEIEEWETEIRLGWRSSH